MSVEVKLLVWETVDTGHGAIFTERAKIYGGWLVRCTTNVLSLTNNGYGDLEGREGYEWRVSLTFVPDPEHRWNDYYQSELDKGNQPKY